MFGYNVKDAELQQSESLPNGANTTTTDPIQLHSGAAKSAFLAECALLLSAPALGATPLPDGQTVTYSIEHSDTIDSGYTAVSPSVVQTGAGGAGAAAATLRICPPDDVKKFVRGKAVKTGAGNASASTFTLELLF